MFHFVEELTIYQTIFSLRIRKNSQFLFFLDSCEDPYQSNPCDENAICAFGTSIYCTCKQGFTGIGTKGNCAEIDTTTEKSCENTGM